jgi:DNA-directed RNA polymerase subunit RPC12/RpoP
VPLAATTTAEPEEAAQRLNAEYAQEAGAALRCQDCGKALQWPEDTSPCFCAACVSRRIGD